MPEDTVETPEVVEAPEVVETPVEDNVEGAEEVLEPDATPTEEDALENSKNPERTKKYIDGLKDENKKYKDVLSSLTPEEKYEAPVQQAPQAEQFQTLQQGDIDQVFRSMVDDQGFVDGNKLLNTLRDLDTSAKNSKQAAEKALEHARRVEVAQQEQQKSATMQTVHEKYPQLDPESESFDSRYWEFVRNELIGQMMEGKQDPLSAAEKGYDVFYKEQQVTKEEKAQKEEKDNAKAQINATRPRSSSAVGYYENEEEEALKAKVQAGKKGALAELLRRRGQ